MQLAVKRDLLQNLATIRLERGAKVVNGDAAQFRHEPVGAARRNAAHPEIVNADACASR